MTLTPALFATAHAASSLAYSVGWDLDLGAGDVTWTPGGGVLLVQGAPLIAQRVALSCLPPPGSVLCEPQLGAGVGAAVGYPLHDATRSHLALAIATQAAADPAIAHVDDVLVDQTFSGRSDLRIGVLANTHNGVPLRLSFGAALGAGVGADALLLDQVTV